MCVCVTGGGAILARANANCAHNSSETARRATTQRRLFSADTVQYQHLHVGVLDLNAKLLNDGFHVKEHNADCNTGEKMK